MAIKKGGRVAIDFSGVESGGGRAVPNGEYLLKSTEVELKDNQAKDGQYLAFKYKVANGQFQGATIWDNCSLKPQALWRFRTLLECFGMAPPDGKMDLDLTKLIGKTVFVEIANEEYQGKSKPRIANFLAGGEAAIPSANSGTPMAFRTGDMVQFDDDGTITQGKVLGISGNVSRVEVDGDEWEIELSELSLLAA